MAEQISVRTLSFSPGAFTLFLWARQNLLGSDINHKLQFIAKAAKASVVKMWAWSQTLKVSIMAMLLTGCYRRQLNILEPQCAIKSPLRARCGDTHL